MVGEDFACKALRVILGCLEQGGLLVFILEDITQRIGSVMEIIVVNHAITTKLTGLGAVLTDDHGTRALCVNQLKAVAAALGIGDNDSLSHLGNSGQVGVVHLVHLLEAVEDVQVMSLLLDDAVKVVGTVT